MCRTCYIRVRRGLKPRTPQAALVGPRTPGKRIVHFGDRYAAGIVWAIENPEKGGCATVVLYQESKSLHGKPAYVRTPLWKLCELTPVQEEPCNRVAAVFVGLPEVANV